MKYAVAYEIADAMKYAAAYKGFILFHILQIVAKYFIRYVIIIVEVRMIKENKLADMSTEFAIQKLPPR